MLRNISAPGYLIISGSSLILVCALMIVLIGVAVLMFIGQRTANALLSTIALSLLATITAALGGLYGAHHRYWSAAVWGVLAFTQAMSARRKWTEWQAKSSE